MSHQIKTKCVRNTAGGSITGIVSTHLTSALDVENLAITLSGRARPGNNQTPWLYLPRPEITIRGEKDFDQPIHHHFGFLHLAIQIPHYRTLHSKGSPHIQAFRPV